MKSSDPDFNCAVYSKINPSTGKQEYCIAFEGTTITSTRDWFEKFIEQPFGSQLSKVFGTTKDTETRSTQLQRI